MENAVTKQDLIDFAASMKEAMQQTMQPMLGEVQTTRGDVQTLQQAMHSMRQEMHSMREEMHSLREEMHSMEDRIVDRVTHRLEGRIDASEERMKDFVAKADFALETKLIAEFWKWGRGSDARTREAVNLTGETSSRVQLLSERLLNAEDRISDLERRIAGVN